MKFLTIFLFTFCTSVFFSQENSNSIEQAGEIFSFCEEEAQFVGGQQAMTKYIVDNFVYPKSCIQKKIQGKVYVRFVIEIDGSITSPKIEKGVSEELDAEVLRLISSMPKWKPAKNNKKEVRSYVRLPVNCVL